VASHRAASSAFVIDRDNSLDGSKTANSLIATNDCCSRFVARVKRESEDEFSADTTTSRIGN
jgi:hypothetical protein